MNALVWLKVTETQLEVTKDSRGFWHMESKQGLNSHRKGYGQLGLMTYCKQDHCSAVWFLWKC